MAELKNDHQMWIELHTQRLASKVEELLEQAGLPVSDRIVAGYTWRLSHKVTNPQAALNSLEDLKVELGLVEQRMIEITEGNWNGNFLYGPESHKPYFTPACLSWTDADFKAVVKWTRDQGLTHLLVNASQDNWGKDRGHPEWTTGPRYPNGFYWWQDDNLKKVVIPRLKYIREQQIQPVLGVLEYQEVQQITQERSIGRAVEVISATREHVPLYQLGWEWDEIWRSEERFEFEKNILRAVAGAANGRDVGIHYSAKKALEGSGLEVQGGWNRAYPGHVVKLYQSERNATVETVEQEARILADVSLQRGTKLCIHEHSGFDSGIGNTYSLGEANDRARRGVAAARAAEVNGHRLSKERTGSMNGLA